MHTIIQLRRNFFFTLLKIHDWSLSKRKFIHVRKTSPVSGFTLVELLIVFTILGTLGVVSIASFSSYNTSQQLNSAALDLKNTLEYAKSQAVSQVFTCPANNQLMGYRFNACCTGATCPTCSSTGYDYEVDEVCSNGAVTTTPVVTTKKLPKGISFVVGGSGGPYTYSFTFNPLSGNVTSGAGTFQIQQGTSATKSISVSGSGVIE